jgi:hypothetical protein
MEQEVFKAHQELIQQDKEITAANLKNRLLGTDTTRRYIIELFKEHNKKMEALVGKEYASGTTIITLDGIRYQVGFLQAQFQTSL